MVPLIQKSLPDYKVGYIVIQVSNYSVTVRADQIVAWAATDSKVEIYTSFVLNGEPAFVVTGEEQIKTALHRLASLIMDFVTVKETVGGT